MSDEIQKLAQKLIQDVNLPKLQAHGGEARRIARKYEPRAVFNRWRDSEEGKAWKSKQFGIISGKCPCCNNSLPDMTYFDIDHKKPLATHPHLAIETNNLRLLCGPCNRSCSSKDTCQISQ